MKNIGFKKLIVVVAIIIAINKIVFDEGYFSDNKVIDRVLGGFYTGLLVIIVFAAVYATIRQI